MTETFLPPFTVMFSVPRKGAGDCSSGRDAFHDLEHGRPTLHRRCYVKEGQFIGAGRAIGLGRFDGVGGVTDVDEVHSLNHATVLHVQARHDLHGFCHDRFLRSRID